MLLFAKQVIKAASAKKGGERICILAAADLYNMGSFCENSFYEVYKSKILRCISQRLEVRAASIYNIEREECLHG